MGILLLIIFILIVINLKQADELRDLERKTLDAFKIVCKKLKQNMEDRYNAGFNWKKLSYTTG